MGSTVEQLGGLRSELVWTCKSLSPRYCGVLFFEVCIAHEGLSGVDQEAGLSFQGHNGPHVSHWLICNPGWQKLKDHGLNEANSL